MSLPATITPALVEHMTTLAGHLAAAGVANPIPTAAALILGTVTKAMPNFTPASPTPDASTAPPQPSAMNAAVQTATRVPVRRPDGTTTTIPAAHLTTAMQYGYKPITT